MKTVGTSLLLFAAVISGCKTWDPANLAVNKQPLSTKLLNLELRPEVHPGTTQTLQDDELAILNKEVEENLINAQGDAFGTISIARKVNKLKKGEVYSIVNGMLLMAPSVVGFPLQRFALSDSIFVKVTDSKNNVIGEYKAAGKATSTVAFYYGYSEEDAPRMVYPEALKEALNNVRPLIQADAQRLNSKLQEAGKL